MESWRGFEKSSRARAGGRGWGSSGGLVGLRIRASGTGVWLAGSGRLQNRAQPVPARGLGVWRRRGGAWRGQAWKEGKWGR